jgi:hypothetical protein
MFGGGGQSLKKKKSDIATQQFEMEINHQAQMSLLDGAGRGAHALQNGSSEVPLWAAKQRKSEVARANLRGMALNLPKISVPVQKVGSILDFERGATANSNSLAGSQEAPPSLIF